jgi:hypothetical protein
MTPFSEYKFVPAGAEYHPMKTMAILLLTNGMHARSPDWHEHHPQTVKKDKHREHSPSVAYSMAFPHQIAENTLSWTDQDATHLLMNIELAPRDALDACLEYSNAKTR